MTQLPWQPLGWTVPTQIMAVPCARVGRLLEQALPTAAHPNSQGCSLLIFTSRIKIRTAFQWLVTLPHFQHTLTIKKKGRN